MCNSAFVFFYKHFDTRESPIYKTGFVVLKYIRFFFQRIDKFYERSGANFANCRNKTGNFFCNCPGISDNTFFCIIWENCPSLWLFRVER